jgi:hypothetical protein
MWGICNTIFSSYLCLIKNLCMKTTKLLFCFSLFTFSFSLCEGQGWDSVGSGLSGVEEWTTSVKCMTVYNGNLFAGGTFTMAGGNPVNYIAKWNGTTWSAVGSGITGSPFPGVLSMAVYNGNLYVGGFFDTAGGNPVSSIAKWDGTAWSAVDSGITLGANTGLVTSLLVNNGNLCVGGSFNMAGGKTASNIAVWNGTTWSALGTGTNLISFH